MTLLDLAHTPHHINQTAEFVYFCSRRAKPDAIPTNASPVDIFAGKDHKPPWLDTINDADTLAVLMKAAIKIGHAANPDDYVEGLTSIINQVPAESFGGEDKKQSLCDWLARLKS